MKVTVAVARCAASSCETMLSVCEPGLRPLLAARAAMSSGVEQANELPPSILHICATTTVVLVQSMVESVAEHSTTRRGGLVKGIISSLVCPNSSVMDMVRMWSPGVKSEVAS